MSAEAAAEVAVTTTRIGSALRARAAIGASGAGGAVAAPQVPRVCPVPNSTTHGLERIAGVQATRGGVLSVERILEVRLSGSLMRQADGASVRILQNSTGRFDVVVEGERGIITTFKNLSQKSLSNLAKNYGWH